MVGGMQKLQAKDRAVAPLPTSLIQQLPPVPPAKLKGLRSSLSSKDELSLRSDSEYPLPLYLTCLSSQLNCILTGTNPEESHYKFLLPLNPSRSTEKRESWETESRLKHIAASSPLCTTQRWA